jgi:Holliday junction resolvase RusA-like endonuclease
MRDTAALTVLGVPAPQGSKTAVTRGGRAFVIEGGSSTGRAIHKAWRQAVAGEALECANRDGPFDPDVPVGVALLFVMPKPKSRPKKARWADRKPDLDKLIRSTLDGLADGGLVAHDSRVVKLDASKVYQQEGGPTGVVVGVWTAGSEGARPRLSETDLRDHVGRRFL